MYSSEMSAHLKVSLRSSYQARLIILSGMRQTWSCCRDTGKKLKTGIGPSVHSMQTGVERQMLLAAPLHFHASSLCATLSQSRPASQLQPSRRRSHAVQLLVSLHPASASLPLRQHTMIPLPTPARQWRVISKWVCLLQYGRTSLLA